MDVLGGFEEAILLARQTAGLEGDQPTTLKVFPRRRNPLDQVLNSISKGDFLALLDGIGDLIRLIGYAKRIVQELPRVDVSYGVLMRAPDMTIE